MTSAWTMAWRPVSRVNCKIKNCPLNITRFCQATLKIGKDISFSPNCTFLKNKIQANIKFSLRSYLMDFSVYRTFLKEILIFFFVILKSGMSLEKKKSLFWRYFTCFLQKKTLVWLFFSKVTVNSMSVLLS